MFSHSAVAQMMANQRAPPQALPDLHVPSPFDMFGDLLRSQSISSSAPSLGSMLFQQPFIPNLQDVLMAQIKQQAMNQQFQQFQQIMKAMNEIQQNQQLHSKIPASPPLSQKLAPELSPGAFASTVPISTTSRKRPSSSSVSGNSKKSSNSSEDHEPAAPKRSKQLRKILAEDNETNSPVSGMYIKELSEVSADDIAKAAELDETASYVHISEESKKMLKEIPNVIGESVCSLCKVKFDDVFKLAMHKCPRIVHEEYKCPECDKIFSCPANLASHRRWHGPRPQKSAPSTASTVSLSPAATSTRESSPTSTPEFNPVQLFLAMTKSASENFTSPAAPEINVVV